MAAKKKSPLKNRRKRIVEEVLIKSVHKPKPYKSRRRKSPKIQLQEKNDQRKWNKEKYLPKLHKKNKRLYNHVRRYKAAVAKRYNDDLEIEMRKRGYFASQIRHAKNYSLVGKNVKVTVDKVVSRYNKGNTRALVKGKWVTIKHAKSLQKRAIKRARIKSYMDILGVSKKKALEILKVIEKDTPAANELKALIY